MCDHDVTSRRSCLDKRLSKPPYSCTVDVSFLFLSSPTAETNLVILPTISVVTVIVTTTREPREITCLKCGGPAQSDCDIRSYSISDTETCMSGCVTINQLRNESMYTI